MNTDKTLTDVYNPVHFRTNDGENLSICMRDYGYEFTYQGKTYEAKNGLIRKMGKEEGEDIRKEVENSVAKILDIVRDNTTNTPDGIFMDDEKIIQEFSSYLNKKYPKSISTLPSTTENKNSAILTAIEYYDNIDPNTSLSAQKITDHLIKLLEEPFTPENKKEGIDKEEETGLRALLKMTLELNQTDGEVWDGENWMTIDEYLQKHLPEEKDTTVTEGRGGKREK